MTFFKTAWYVIYTRSHHEKKVADCLSHLQAQFYLPTIKTLKIWDSKKKYLQLPLFPGYVFVKMDSTELYLRSLQIPGVLYYVRTGKQIAEVSESIIAKLHAIVANDGNDIEVSFEHIKKGSNLNIKAGPFKGFDCEVVEHRGKCKVLVRLEFLRRNILVDLPSYCLLEDNSVFTTAAHYM